MHSWFKLMGMHLVERLQERLADSLMVAFQPEYIVNSSTGFQRLVAA
jgi:hypothetical protein